jgi:hypothetical protein
LPYKKITNYHCSRNEPKHYYDFYDNTTDCIFFFYLFLPQALPAQSCTTLGQNPSTAFPICGTTTFSQNTVSICGGRATPTRCARDGNDYADKNPFWYKFTCFAAGTPAFEITPLNLQDDYDWQLFDITGRNPDEVFTNSALSTTYLCVTMPWRHGKECNDFI